MPSRTRRKSIWNLWHSACKTCVDFRDKIPGLREAIARENELRNDAFNYDVPELIGGVWVRPLTPLLFARLQSIKSPFLTGDIPLTEHVVQFLWCVSVDFKVSRWAAFWFAARCRGFTYDATCSAINAYLNDAFADLPSHKIGCDDNQYFGALAPLIDQFGSEYGWTFEQTMRTPFKVLFQCQRCMRMRYNPHAIMFNPSDKLRSDWLAQMNSQHKEDN